jgi:hypothetical protein
MRIVVKFPSRAYAELVADLEQIPSRERAERLRLLASVGVTVLRSGPGLPADYFLSQDSRSDSADTSAKRVKTGFHRVRDRLKAGMLG